MQSITTIFIQNQALIPFNPASFVKAIFNLNITISNFTFLLLPEVTFSLHISVVSSIVAVL